MTQTSAILSLAIALSVVLSGTHAKDITAIPVRESDTTAHRTDEQQIIKVSGELHNHVDKQAGKVFSSSDNPQSDTRSLRLVRDVKKARRTPLSTIDAWREYLALYLG